MKVGIITFHAATNYGAVLQAFALQKYIMSMGHKCVLIDYRTASQEDFNALYSKRNGIKSIIKNVLLLRYDSARRLRKTRFSSFLDENLELTKKTYWGDASLSELNNDIDCFITGSDQVWNVRKEADVKPAYFLNFVNESKRKIAYAVSLGSASYDDMKMYKEHIDKFNALSCREKFGTYIIKKISGGNVKHVLDPTLLVNNTVFRQLVDEKRIIEEDYILYYSLDGFDHRKRNSEILEYLREKTGKKIIALTPEWPQNKKNITAVIDAGPREFLNLIANADLICTNSFHGTSLSISFQKDFFVLADDNDDDRKNSILELLSLTRRKINTVNDIRSDDFSSIDYDYVNSKLEELRLESREYLERSISGETL